MSALDGTSKYLNNLLLARGLLPDGKSINFAHDDTAGAADATMAKIVNLVHDLVLRRDRDAEQHQVIVAKIKDMQAEEKQRSVELQRLHIKADGLRNKASAAEAHERAARVDMERLELQLKTFKDQNLRMKSMVDQIRAKCIGDVKKRDTEITQLRNHIAGLQRSRRTATDKGSQRHTQQSRLQSRMPGEETANANQDWTLEHESSDLLKEIINETTDENVTLRKILSQGIATLKDISGMEIPRGNQEERDGIGIPGQYRKSRQVAAAAAQSDALVPCHTLELDLQQAIEHCKSILKDPSFVPIEEVQLREEEIAKLTAGWEKMADRWKKAVTMMAQWKQRMQNDGNQDLAGWSDLSLRRSTAVRPNGEPILGTSDMSSIFDHDEQDQPAISGAKPSTEESSIQQDRHSTSRSSSERSPESELELVPEPAHKRLASSPAKRGVSLPRVGRPLAEISGNASQGSSVVDPRSTQAKLLNSHSSVEQEDDTFHHRKLRSKSSKSHNSTTRFANPTVSTLARPLPRLTVAEKLAAIEAEAIEARKASSKRKLPHDSFRTSVNNGKRRSTLSPDELALLMNDGP